ncbi:segregation and condensation protein B [Kiloniella litopenaei]|uniref:Segregation and condensation protein B n=1 Tax=Kiloniella litopenaei TaxID=1549748 RepID=A0A0M2RDD2_9PROT|nr:SMC-Scp complex subunit ScpB [Kiloniella litopenaei]KKJ77568.1 segregation and condensation protein B [Kiloniella litopenaei]
METRFDDLRLLEALLFASTEPVSVEQLSRHFQKDRDLKPLLEELKSYYENRGVNLIKVEDRWAFRTAPDMAPLLRVEQSQSKQLTRAGVETLAIIAYHQPVTRAEIEEIRGVSLSKGTLDTLLEIGWVKPKGRRRTPGRPVTWATSQAFLDNFALESLDDLPGFDELKVAGLLDARPAITALGDHGDLLSVSGDGVDLEKGDDHLSNEFGEDLADEESEQSSLPV